jgi:arsenite methyltransferase
MIMGHLLAIGAKLEYTAPAQKDQMESEHMTEPERDMWAEWLLSRRHGGDPDKYEPMLQAMLHPLRDKVLEHASLAAGQTVLDVGCGDGLIALEAAEKVGDDGLVIFSDISPYLLEFCQRVAERKGLLHRCRFVQAAAEDLSPVGDGTVDAVTVRSVLIYVQAKQQAFREFQRVLKPQGRLSIFEPINRFGLWETRDRFWGYDVAPVADLAATVRAVFERIQPPDTDPMLDFDERDLLEFATQAGFAKIEIEYGATVSQATACSWEELASIVGNPRIPSLQEAIGEVLTPAEAERFVAHLRPLVESGEGSQRGASAFLWAVK